MPAKAISERTAGRAAAGAHTSLDLNLLLVYLEIVNSGSISRAAVQAGVPKPTLSRKLRQLEQQMGAVLLKRGPHKLEMTEVGRALFKHCERIAAEAAEASSIAADMQSQLKGTMRISIPMGIGNTWISHALARFAMLYPDLRLTIHVTNSWIDVSEEPYDVALYIGRVRNEHLPVRRLADLQRGVYASLERKGVPQAPSDLLQHECIALESQLADGLWKFKTANGVTVATPRMTSSDILVVREMVMAGLGCGILTHALSEQDVRAGRLVRVLPNWRIPAIPVLAMFLERRHMPQRVRALIDIFAQAIKVQSA
jgi:LysR family transcriptional regulator, regulator for bpeEF and oprC